MSASDYCVCSRREITALLPWQLLVLEHRISFVQGNNGKQCSGMNLLRLYFCIKWEGNCTILYLNESIIIATNSRPALSVVSKLAQLRLSCYLTLGSCVSGFCLWCCQSLVEIAHYAEVGAAMQMEQNAVDLCAGLFMIRQLTEVNLTLWNK